MFNFVAKLQQNREMTGTFQSNYLMTYLSKLSLAGVRTVYPFGCLEAPRIY